VKVTLAVATATTPEGDQMLETTTQPTSAVGAEPTDSGRSDAGPAGAVSEAPAAVPAQPRPGDLVVADLLVEDVSIDGMCGVY
jgi:mycofactocin precursor